MQREQSVSGDIQASLCSEKISLRDYFASKAMQALIQNRPTAVEFQSGIKADIAEDAYRFADAMLEARVLEFGKSVQPNASLRGGER